MTSVKNIFHFSSILSSLLKSPHNRKDIFFLFFHPFGGIFCNVVPVIATSPKIKLFVKPEEFGPVCNKKTKNENKKIENRIKGRKIKSKNENHKFHKNHEIYGKKEKIV